MKVVGYTPELSVRPGQRLRFMVSCDTEEYHADVVRLIHGDTDPEGPGFRADPVETGLDRTFPGRVQPIHQGSHVLVEDDDRFHLAGGFTLQVLVCATTPGKGTQGLVTHWQEGVGGYGLAIGEDSDAQLWLGSQGNIHTLGSGRPMLAGCWYLVSGSLDADGTATLVQEPVVTATNGRFAIASSFDSTRARVTRQVPGGAQAPEGTPLVMAGYTREHVDHGIGTVVGGHFNGKLDRPRLHSAALTAEQVREQVLTPGGRDLVAAWDFDAEITPEGIRRTSHITDVSANRLHGRTVNRPTRGMTGHNWRAKEQNFVHAPHEYAAVHFHDDDLDDARWEEDFTLDVPEDLPSGVYAVRLRAEDDTDHVPFYVRAPKGSEKRVCLLVPTASYMAYANDHVTLEAPLAQLMVARNPVMDGGGLHLSKHREFGLSTYDHHSDGTGVAHSSRLRPILNMRPGFRHWLSPSLWQFNADLHLVDWLTAKGYDFDVVTDEDLHLEGVQAVRPYRTVITGSHPEYYSEQMLDALHAYADEGGRMMYMGANGFYWVTAFDPENPGIIEVRKGNGSNAWKCRPGEYHLSFTGEYGTLWRHRGRAPQRLFGVGFGSEGFDESSYYRRTPDGMPGGPAEWMFEGIGPQERIGDFGLVGGGASGLELDVYDAALGTPPEAVIGAASQDHSDIYLEVAEELYFNVPGVGGTQSARVRADIVYFPTPRGGGVWSASSIAYCGSLSHNGYDNNVSRLTANVLDRFLSDEPAPSGASG